MHAFWNNSNLKPPVARKLAVRHPNFVCLTASFLTTYGDFFKLFLQNSMIFPRLFRSFFFKFNDFSMHGTVFGDFPGFPWFPELVGTLQALQKIVEFKDFSRPLSNFTELFKADLIFKYFSRNPSIFKYFSNLCKPCVLIEYLFELTLSFVNIHARRHPLLIIILINFLVGT